MGLSAASFLNREYSCILRRCAWYNAFNYFVAVSSAFYGVSAMADQITIDGRTQTQLSISGSVTDITTQTVQGVNALNSFHRFNIGNGQTVNLYLPNGTANLLNLVHDERSQLDGVMNAYKDGHIGGNVFFLNPYGVVVGAEGSINVGSLTMATPTPQFMDSLIGATGQVNESAVDNVLSGKIPLTESGLIRVKGRINAVDSINLSAGQIAVDASSHLIAGRQAQVAFGDLVNVEGIAVGSEVKVENGVISILAAGDVDVAGQISVDGSEGQDAGQIDIQAGGDVHLTAGADVSASGQGMDSSGGTVVSYAQGNATLESGAVVAANGGVTGDGGFAEFSAKNTVNIDGGKLKASAPGGKAGEILIDPTELLWTGSGHDQFTDGTSYTITAADRVVLDDVTISTRKLDSANNNRANVATAASIGDSGDLTIKSSKIELKNGAALYAQADGGHLGGTVTLEARDEAVLPTLGWATATAQIDIGNATIKAKEVVIDAKSNIDSQFVYSSEDPLDSTLNVTTATAQQIGGFLLSLGGVEMVVSDVDAKAHVNLTSGANIEATNGVTLSAENVTKAGMAKKPPSPGSQFNTPLGIGALWVSDKSDAQVNVGSGVSIKSGDLNVRAHNDASLEGSIASAKNQTQNSSFTAIAAGITQADVQAGANIASGATLTVSGNLTLAATNVGSYTNEVISETGPNGRAAAAVAYSDHQSGVNASLNADVGDATKVEIIAINDVLKDQATAFSKVGGSEIDSIIANGQEKVSTAIGAEDFFWGKLGLQNLKPDNKSSPTQQSFRIGGAIAYDNSSHKALAEIGDDTTVHVTDSAAVISRVRAEEMKIAAEAAAISTSASKPGPHDTSRQAYSVGLAIANYHHDAKSRVGANAAVTAPKIAVYSDTIIPIRDSLLFGSKDATDNWTRWDGLETIQGALDSITNIFDVFNGVSSAKSKSDGSDGSINLSGSVSILNYDDNSRAIVDAGAQLNVTGSETGKWSTSMDVQAEKKNYDPLGLGILISTDPAVKEDFSFDAPVTIQAKHDATLLFQAGDKPSSSGEKGLGVAFNDIDVTTKTEAIVREGVVIHGVTETANAAPEGGRTWTQTGSFATEDVSISAKSDERIISLAVSGGYGATYGANGTYSQVNLNNSTHALVDDEVEINAKVLDVKAKASPVVWSLSGGINISKNASVGIGIAINDVIGSTRAEIADNDTWSLDDAPRSSLVDIIGSGVHSSDIDVEAKTGGHLEAIAVTGAVANKGSSSGGQGFFDKVKDSVGYTGAISKAQKLASSTKGGDSNQDASGGVQESAKKPPSYSFAGAGSGAINVTEMMTTAKVEGVTIDQTAVTPASLAVRAIADSDITAATGAAAITRANNPDTTKTVGVAGSVAVNSIGNGTQAWLKDSKVTEAGDVTVQALSGGEQLAVALGMAVDATTASTQTKSDSFVGSLSLTLAQTDDNDDSKNKIVAKIDNTDITGKTGVTGRDVEVTAYNRTYIGTGGGSLAVKAGTSGNGSSIGAAVSWANVRNDVFAGIVGDSHISEVDTVGVHAYNATEIGAGAAMLGLSNAEGQNSFEGSLVLNQITNNTTAAIEKSTVTATGLVDVEARDKGADAALETLIDPDGDRNNTAKGLDYCGESAGGATPSGNCITAVAGTVQAGRGNNFGLSIAYNQIKNNLTAKVKDSSVNVTGTDSSNRIKVNAQSDTSILGVAFGVGVSTNKMSGAGSISIAGIENNVVAEVGESDTNGLVTTLTAPTVEVTSTDDSKIQTVAGQVNVSVKDKALGAAFAYNEIKNATHSTVDNATISALNSIDVTSNEKATIETLSAAGGLAKDTAASLSASLNFIDNTSEARVSDSYFKDGGANTATDTNTVTVKAEDGSTLRSLAGSVAVGMETGAGAAFSLNQVSNANTALVENSTIEGVSTFKLKAVNKAVIETLAAAVGAGKSGFSGSITLNNIGQSFAGSNPNTTTAELKDSTVRYGSGSTMTIEGKDDSQISSIAGSVAIGTSGSAFGAAVADNNIQSTAKGSVTGSSILNNSSLAVSGNNSSIIKTLSAAGSGGSGAAFAGSASSNRTKNTTTGEIVDSEITGATSNVDVSALNGSKIEALSGGAALSTSSGAGAFGIAISVNDIDDTTAAHVTGKKVSGYTLKDMQVAAASDATIKALSIGAAVTSEGSVAAAGSIGVNLISSHTSAYIDGDAVVLADNNVGVTAESDDAITVISGSVGIAAGEASAAGVGVGFNTNFITSNTQAYISGANTSVTGLAKDAGVIMNVYNGELTTGVDLANQVDTLTFSALDLKNNKATESLSGVAVNASSSQQIENITGTLGGSTGVGASVAGSVNDIGGTTQAYVLNAKINNDNTGAGTNQKVAITASNIAYDNSFVVAVGVGGANAGGLGVDTHLMNRTTSARVTGGSIDAKNAVAVKAESTQGISSMAAGGAASAGNSGAGTLSLALFKNTTEALVSGANINASALDIKAQNTNDMFLMAGAVSIGGGNAGGGAFAVGSSDSKTKAKLTNTNATKSGAVNVDAINKTDINHIVISGAGGGANGVAGMADVNLVTDKTEATIENSTIGTSAEKAASVHVAATHTLAIDSKAGALGVGLSGGGVGAGASVNIIKANTVATVNNSDLYANGLVDVNALSTKDVDATALTAGVGSTVGIGGAAVVTLVGDDVSGDASDEVGGSLSAVDKFTVIDNRFEDLPDTGAGGPVILSQADQDSLNADTQKSTMDVTGSAGGYTFKTAAEIKGTNTIDSGSLDVIATDKTDTKALVGGVGLALGGGVGGGVAVTNVKANVAANVSGTALTTNGNINVKATADNDNGKTIEILALAGGAGLVGVGAAVSYADISNHVDANLSSGANAGAGTVTVTAKDKTDIESDAKGAAVGAAAAGVVISNAEKNSTINASAGDVITAGSAMISATDEGLVKAIGQSAVGGLNVGIGGAIVDASDVSNISSLTLDNTTFNLGSGTLNLLATGTPQTYAQADGVAVSAGLGIGASLAHADSSAVINATLGSNNTVTASELNIKAIRALNIGGAPSSYAKAFGASGGLLLGANATVAKAFSGGSTIASVGNDSTLLVSGTTVIKGESHTQQTSSGLGFSGGIIAIGADYSEAKSSTYTKANLGNDVKVSGDRLDVLSSSEDTNYAYGVAGSGGAISAPFSEAKTINTSETYANTGSGNNTLGDERKIDVTTLNISATHDANFDSWMENTNASLLGASGAKATNTVSAITGASIGNNGYIEADNIALDATNSVLKASPVTIPGLSVSVPTWNVNSSSGGLADVPAAGSNTSITTEALVQVGDNAHLEQSGLQSAPGTFTLNALNNVTATDKVKMSSGGLVSAASGKSSILADINNATVRVGDNSVTTSMGDIAMGARSIADISTQTAVDVYGLVGVAPAGDSVSRFQAVNTIDIGAASINSLNDIKLSAGADTAGQANDTKTTARSDVYNNTAIPASRDPVADAVIGTHSQINIAPGANLGAVRHIALFAEEGSAVASGVGIGKDIYREALAAVGSAISNAFGGGDVSFETKTGNSITSQTSDVTVNGELHVGTHRKQFLDIGLDGLATSQTDGISITNTDFKAVAADILDRIKVLDDLIQKYSVTDVNNPGANTDASANIAVVAYRSEKEFLQRKLKDINYSADSQGGFTGVANISAKQAAQSSVDGMTQTRDAYQTTKTQLTTDNATLTSSTDSLNNDNTKLTTANSLLQNQIDALDPTKPADQQKILTLQTSIDNNNSTITTNNSTITSNTSTITTNDGLITDLNGKISPLDTLITETQTKINNNVFSDVVVGGPVAKILTISDSTAQLGNIYVRADTLRGKGSLDAPGDAEIKIVNNGPSFLKLNDLIIPPDEGGKIYLNSVDVNDNAEINGVNGATGADFTIFTADSQIDSAGNAVPPGQPQILIESKYDPLNPYYTALTSDGTPALAPDIIMQGEVSNLRGLVKVDSAAGSIRVEDTANIRAGSVDIKTKNGDFVQSYTDTMFHVNGAPRTTIPGDPQKAFPANVDTIVKSPELAGGGIVANGSVLISARYLNINGNIQSGIPEWGVKIPDAATVKIGKASGTFAQAQADYNALSASQKEVLGAEFYTVDGATVQGLVGSKQGGWQKIDVNYNAKENRLELGGVQVQGGYIELFGEIFNTNPDNNTDIAQNIGGKLRVLDGYGQINVDNQTNLPLWVNLLDTGRGVQGEINITNIKGLDPDTNLPIISTQTFTRNPGGARTGQTFTPTAGLSYSMMVGYDSMTTDYYRYSQNGWFGITDAPVEDQYRIDSVTNTNDPLSRAEFLQNTPGLNLKDEVTETTSTSDSGPIAGNSWKDCNWWTACANATYYQEYTVVRGDKTTKTQSVKADNPINIEFIGFDNGSVNVASTGNVVFNSAINNRDGDIRVNSSGSITQNGDLAIMNGNNISLTSSTGMGDASQSLLLNVNKGGKLDATSASGELHLTQVVGDLQVGDIGGAGVSKVVLEAERNLLGVDSNSKVQAQRVELMARNGGIGELSDSVDTQFKVRTAYSTDQSQWSDKGLIATARGNINLINTEDTGNASVYSGNLLLISAESKAGDVHIETTGKVIDNNPFATTDIRTQAELADLWDSMALRGSLADDKADEAVASYARGQENNYKLYWQLRGLQADGGASYDANFKYQLSQSQQDALSASGMSAAQIQEFADSRTTQYHQLNDQVGGFTTAFDDGYRFDVTGLESSIREGSSWSDAQLQLSVGSGLLKNITDTVTTIKTPNVKGNNISLLAGSDIGSFDDALTIDLTAPLTDLTIEQKAALAAAEKGDVTVNGDVLSITQARPVNVTTGSGSLNAKANGLLLIGSEKDLKINQVTTSGDIRIKTSGALINAASAGVVNVEGLNMILEAANGGIGSDSSPLLVNAAVGAGVTARAKNDIWIKSLFDFNIDTMYSPNNINLDAQGSIFDFQTTEVLNNEDLNIRGNFVMLTAQNGSIGTAVNALDVSVNKDGLINADASTSGQGVYLNGTRNENFRVSSVTSGNEVVLTSADDVVLTEGTVTAVNKIKLESGTDGSGSIDINEESNNGYTIDAASTLDMKAANDMTIKGRIRSQGSANLVTGDDLTLAGGSITGAGQVNLESGSDGSGSIEVNKESTGSYAIDTASTLDMKAANDMTIKGRIRSQGSANLITGDDFTLAGGSITSAGQVNLGSGSDGTGSINLESSNPDFNAVKTTETLILTAADEINIIANIQADRGLKFNAGHATNLTDGAISTSGRVAIASNDTLTIGGKVFGGAGIGIVTPNDVVFNGGSLTSDNDINIEAGTDGSGSILGSSSDSIDIVALGTLDLQAVNHIGGENALTTEVDNRANFRSADINAEVSSTPLENPLTLSVSDIGGGPSNRVEMKVNSNSSVTFDLFNVEVAYVTAKTPSLQVPNGEITNYAVFNMPLYNSRFDTLSRDAHPGYDVNAYTLSGDFSLDALADSVTVGALVLQQNPDLQWIGKKPENVVDKVQTILQPVNEGDDFETNNPQGINMQTSGYRMFQNPYVKGSLVDVSLNWFSLESASTQPESKDKKEIEN